jgi:predicted 2-oxoglutarate/Fe(II)-dependent dioxygenase YbiX
LVLLHFQNPVSREIRGGDLVLYEWMLLARVRLPFPDIARELVLYLGVSPSQIAPNAWRYLFASFILWRTVVEARMTIPEFFNVYRITYKREGVVEFTMRMNPIFIYHSPNYSNN